LQHYSIEEQNSLEEAFHPTKKKQATLREIRKRKRSAAFYGKTYCSPRIIRVIYKWKRRNLDKAEDEVNQQERENGKQRRHSPLDYYGIHWTSLITPCFNE